MDTQEQEAGDFPASSIAEALPLKCNVSDDVLYANIKAAMDSGVPFVRAVPPHGGVALIVGGGPSAEFDLDEIKARQADGQIVFALNGAAWWLLNNGITPNAMVVLDARPHNAKFVRGLPNEVRLYLAAQCNPAVFDAGKGHRIKAWHVPLGGKSNIPVTEDMILIGGSTTVGMRALRLVHVLGYREVHLFGYDSSYRDGYAHSYDQPENSNDRIRECVVNNRAFVSTAWMIRQADDFQFIAEGLMAEGMSIHVHGDGLLPEVARALGQALKEAA